MPDHTGFEHAADLSYKPRGGQWVAFDLADKDKQIQLAAAGAHAARDGGLVAIHRPGYFSVGVEHQRGGGQGVERSGGEYVPPALVLVDSNGHNFALPQRNAQGHGTWVDVHFHPGNPAVQNLRPVTDLLDMPPGRVVAEGWRPAA